MILIKNAEVITAEDCDYKNGYITIKNSKIWSVGDMKDFKEKESAFSEVIDANGYTVLPGFVDAHCHIGIFEEGMGDEGADGNEMCDPITPQLRAIDAINPFDPAFSDAVKAGVTTVVTGPGSANVIGGQFAALKTYGKCVDDMVIKSPAAMKAALGENPKAVYGSKREAPFTRMATASLMREALFKAKEYLKKKTDYNNDTEENERPDFDFKCEALLPVLKGEIPMKVHAHRADDICTAIRIADEFGIRITLEHCTEGHLIADIIAKKNIPVMLGPTMTSRSKIELKNLSYDVYKAFENEGICFAIITDHGEITIDNLYLCAALAFRHGISKETALRAITINAAKNTEIDNRVGSIKAGKDADILIMSGELFSLESKIEHVFIDGKKVFSA